MKEPGVHTGVDLWTVISVSVETATIWLRSESEPNSDAYKMLLPGLDDLAPDDAQEATDIVNTLFPPNEALQFIRMLLRHPDKGFDHRIVNINQPGVMALLRRVWGNRVVDEFFPFGSWDPFSVNAVEIPVAEFTNAIELSVTGSLINHH